MRHDCSGSWCSGRSPARWCPRFCPSVPSTARIYDDLGFFDERVDLLNPYDVRRLECIFELTSSFCWSNSCRRSFPAGSSRCLRAWPDPVPGSSRRSFLSWRMEPLPSAIRSNPVQACISREDEHPGPKEQAAEMPSEGHTRLDTYGAHGESFHWVAAVGAHHGKEVRAGRDSGWRFSLGDDARTIMAYGMLRPRASSRHCKDVSTAEWQTRNWSNKNERKKRDTLEIEVYR